MDRIKEFSHALYLKLKKSYEQRGGLDENFLVLLLVVIVMMGVMTLLGQQLMALFSHIAAALSF
jgi:hypothetical protein